MQRPLFRFTVFLVTGIMLGRVFLYFPWSAIALLLLTVPAAVIRTLRSDAPSGPIVLALSGSLAGALLLVLTATRVPDDHFLRTIPLDGSVRSVAGRISSPLDRDPGRTAFLLALEEIDDTQASGSLRVTIRSDQLPLGYGDRITVRGRPFPARGFRNPGGFDYPAHLARQGISAVMSVRSVEDIRIQEQGSGLLRKVQDMRERIRQALVRSTEGEGSAVLQAMVLGEEGGLTDDLRERFMAAGVTHILSISGSHLGLVAVLCFWISRRLLFLLPERRYHRLTLRMDPRKAAAVLTVIPVTFYAFLAGGQVATIRSLIMILAGLAALVADRDSDVLSAMSLAALATLLPAPQALFDISFQLSYLSVLTIVLVVRDGKALTGPATGKRRWWNALLLLLAISLTAAIATGPLVAYHFNQVSFAGIIANMVVVPFAGAVVVPLGLASGILSLFSGSLPLAGLNQLAADFFVAMVRSFSALPFASAAVPSPGPLFFIGYCGVILSSAVWFRALLFARFRPLEFPAQPPRLIPALAAASAAVLIIALVMPRFGAAETRVTFLDVGQGDCALAETADGGTVLIDGGGTRDNRFDIGRRVVVPYLRDRGIRALDLVVLSHPHPDHMNGLLSVLRDVPVREIWWSGHDEQLEGFSELRAIAKHRGTPLRIVSAGDQGTAGSVVIEALHPPRNFRRTEGRKAYAAENDRSLVVRLRSSGSSFLFTGDLHREGEADLLESGIDIRADVIKAPHHGSRTSSSGALIQSVRPRIAVISVGDGNLYRHPAGEVIERYENAGAPVFRTDRNGAIIVTSGRSGLAMTCWTDLVLQQIDAARPGSWGAREWENWERVRIRTTGI